MTELTNQDQWVNDLKEAIAKSFCYVVIGTACFGAAASSFLAIPGLLNLLSLELPSYILYTIYSIAVINGVSYSVSQFWDGLLESTRVNLFGLPPAHKKEIQKENLNTIEKIKDIEEEIRYKIRALDKLGINLKNNPELRLILTHVQHFMKLDGNILKDLNLLDSKSQNQEMDDSNPFYNMFYNILFYANSFFASIVISTGILTSIILTILGTTSAIATLAPMILGPATLGGLTISAMACFVAFCSQYCKSSTFGQKQWNLLMLDLFNSVDDIEEEHLAPKDKHIKLQGYLAEINEIYLDRQRGQSSIYSIDELIEKESNKRAEISEDYTKMYNLYRATEKTVKYKPLYLLEARLAIERLENLKGLVAENEQLKEEIANLKIKS